MACFSLKIPIRAIYSAVSIGRFGRNQRPQKALRQNSSPRRDPPEPSKCLNQRSRTEDGGRRTEDRRQKTEDKGQMPAAQTPNAQRPTLNGRIRRTGTSAYAQPAFA